MSQAQVRDFYIYKWLATMNALTNALYKVTARKTSLDICNNIF